MESLAVELKKIHIYNCFNAGCRHKKLESFPGDYIEGGKFLLSSGNNKLIAVGLWAIARSSNHYEHHHLTINNVHLKLNKLQLYLEALKYDNTFSDIYCGIARVITSYVISTLLPDGRKLNKLELYLEALRLDPLNCCALVGKGYALIGKNNQDSRNLFIKAIECNPYYSEAYCGLAVITDSSIAITLHDGRNLNKRQLFIEALRYNMDREDIRDFLCMTEPINDPWSWFKHSLGLCSKDVNHLFATLFLSLQKLEEKGTIDLAHQAMFEDMLALFWKD